MKKKKKVARAPSWLCRQHALLARQGLAKLFPTPLGRQELLSRTSLTWGSVWCNTNQFSYLFILVLDLAKLELNICFNFKINMWSINYFKLIKFNLFLSNQALPKLYNFLLTLQDPRIQMAKTNHWFNSK